jgi:hypothetical protein
MLSKSRVIRYDEHAAIVDHLDLVVCDDIPLGLRYGLLQFGTGKRGREECRLAEHRRHVGAPFGVLDATSPPDSEAGPSPEEPELQKILSNLVSVTRTTGLIRRLYLTICEPKIAAPINPTGGSSESVQSGKR